MNNRNKNTAFSETEIRQAAQIKRFNECLQADSVLRKRLYNNKELTPKQKEWLADIGIDLDINELSFFWKFPVETNTYLRYIDKELEGEIRDRLNEVADKYPLLELWGRFTESRRVITTNFTDQCISITSSNELFNSWRRRRIAAAKSELGHFGTIIGHPVFAFELNEGCSVGCWFCSFATSKLSATLDYPQKRDEVLSIVRQCADMFGNDMIRMSLPYYRTEPHDNPHYIDFLKDYEKETGAVFCTSTAVCNDIEWIKKLIDYYQNRENGIIYYWPRLSILSLSVLRKIYSFFTPMETKDMEFLIQVKDHERPKVTGGRILEEQAGMRGVKDFASLDRDEATLTALAPQGTIACVSGFNINLASRTIMIFSPCYTSNKWPHGFRVFGEAKYKNESDFTEVMNELVERCMFMLPPKDKILKYRDDIVFHPTEEGFDLATPNQLHHFKGKNKCGPLGQLIAEGTYTYTQISKILLTEHKVNPIIMRTVVQQLFDEGFIDEVYEN